jgi:hypothetical protein
MSDKEQTLTNHQSPVHDAVSQSPVWIRWRRQTVPIALPHISPRPASNPRPQAV